MSNTFQEIDKSMKCTLHFLFFFFFWTLNVMNVTRWFLILKEWIYHSDSMHCSINSHSRFTGMQTKLVWRDFSMKTILCVSYRNVIQSLRREPWTECVTNRIYFIVRFCLTVWVIHLSLSVIVRSKEPDFATWNAKTWERSEWTWDEAIWSDAHHLHCLGIALSASTFIVSLSVYRNIYGYGPSYRLISERSWNSEKKIDDILMRIDHMTH